MSFRLHPASDYTMYPFSTQNPKDFQNLLSVYLDAAFFPCLRELDFWYVLIGSLARTWVVEAPSLCNCPSFLGRKDGDWNTRILVTPRQP